MNKELSTVIHVHDHATAEDFIFYADKFSFEPTLANTAPGLLYDCGMDRVIEKPEASICKLFATPRSCTVKFTDTTGNDYKIGVWNIPAQVTITTLLNNARLTVVCNTTVNPYL